MELSDKEIIDMGKAAYNEPSLYSNVVTLPNGKKACLARFLFTWAILSDITRYGYGKRFCYKSKGEALDALEDWSGEGLPSGKFVNKSSE